MEWSPTRTYTGGFLTPPRRVRPGSDGTRLIMHAPVLHHERAGTRARGNKAPSFSAQQPTLTVTTKPAPNFAAQQLTKRSPKPLRARATHLHHLHLYAPEPPPFPACINSSPEFCTHLQEHRLDLHPILGLGQVVGDVLITSDRLQLDAAFLHHILHP